MTAAEVGEAKQIFLLLLLNIVITLSTMVFRSVINAHERFFFLKGMETIQLVMQPVLVVLVLQQHPSAFSVATVQTVLNLVLSGARVYYCFHDLHVKIHFHYWNHELFSEFKKLALSVFAVSLIDQVFWKTNQIILGIISGTAAVAVYSIASLIYMNYMALSPAISGVYLPHVTGMVARKEPISNLSELFIQIGRWQYYLLALVATGFIIFGKQFIALWAGPGFEDSYTITLLIILPFTVDLIQNIGLAIMQAMNCYDFRARIYFLTGALNLLLAIPLGIKYGGIWWGVGKRVFLILWIYYELVLCKGNPSGHRFLLETDRQNISGYRCMSRYRICCQYIPFASKRNSAFRFEGSNVYSLICGNSICLCHESIRTRENSGYFKEDTLILSLGRGKDCNILLQTDFR